MNIKKKKIKKKKSSNVFCLESFLLCEMFYLKPITVLRNLKKKNWDVPKNFTIGFCTTPSCDHSWLTLKLPFKIILRKFEVVFWCLGWECTFQKIDENSLKSTNTYTRPVYAHHMDWKQLPCQLTFIWLLKKEGWLYSRYVSTLWTCFNLFYDIYMHITGKFTSENGVIITPSPLFFWGTIWSVWELSEFSRISGWKRKSLEQNICNFKSFDLHGIRFLFSYHTNFNLTQTSPFPKVNTIYLTSL